MQPYVSALNNACWAIGLLMAALPAADAAPFAAPSAERLIALLSAGSSSEARRVRENAAISLGRVAAVAPAALAPALPRFLGDWCLALAALKVRPLRHRCLAYVPLRADVR